MARHHVADLVAEDGGEPVLVLGDGENARVHRHLAPGQSEGIDLLVVLNEPVLPLGVRKTGDGGNALAHSGDHLVRRRVVGELGLAHDLLEGLHAHLALLLRRDELELGAARVRHRLARRENHRRQHGGHD